MSRWKKVLIAVLLLISGDIMFLYSHTSSEVKPPTARNILYLSTVMTAAGLAWLLLIIIRVLRNRQ